MQLHVNLNVRVAVVPPVHGHNGYLLPLEPSAAQTACDPISSLPTAAGCGGNMLLDLHKRATSGVVSASTSLRTMAAPRNISGRDDSYTALSPCSAPNVILSGQAGYASPLRSSEGKVTPFALPSSLLLQLLRPGSFRLGNASCTPSVHAGNFHSQLTMAAPTTDEPTVRSIVTRACESMTTQCCSDLQPAEFLMSSSVLASARDSNIQVQLNGASANCIPQRGGVGVNSGVPPFVSTGAVSGMVVANLHAWMQDVERPSSDVALLMMAARGRGALGGAGPGRPSLGGVGGAALGGGPACLVALGGCALPRPGVAAAAASVPAAPSGSIHAARSVKTGRRSADWVQNLEASMRGGVAVDLSIKHDNGHGNGVSCGPCVAVYITAQERLPTSLLRAVKDRAAGLLELLLPACFSSLTTGTPRAEVENLANASAATFAGGSRSKRSLPAALAIGLHSSPGPCGSASGVGGLQTPPYPSPSQLHLHSALTGLAGGSPIASVIGGGSDEAGPSPRAAALLCSIGARLGPSGLPSASGPPVPVVLPASAHRHNPLRLLEMAVGTEGGNPAPGAQTSGTEERMSTSTAALSREIHLLAQQHWPESVGSRGGGGGAGGQGAYGGQAYPCCPPPAVPPAMTASSHSRTTRGSPESCGFRAGIEESSLMVSMDVTCPMDDVSSMRDNLDVWVHSFWEMLRDAPPNKSGHTHGSYADDDLRYLRLHQRLGSGGAASVYAGVLLGMDVAVKVIEPPPEIDVEALASTQPLGPSGSLGETKARPRAGEGPEGQEAESEEGRMAELAAAVRQAQMRELVRSARECAVLTIVSHPAIVQVYSYHTRVQVVPGEGPDGLPRLVPVPPGEGGETQGPLHSVLVMERCDLGSLADALDNGMFKKAIIAAANNTGPLSATSPPVPRSQGGGARHPLSGGQMSNSGGGSTGFTFATSPSCGGSGGGGIAMRAIYLTLLEVALALRHLHSMNLVHCDIKVANVLLKSSSSDPRGFTCKLSDFGLVNLLRSEEESPEHEHEQGSDRSEKAAEGAPRRQGEAEGRRAVTGGWEGCKPWMRNADAAGTVTHLAPECFEPDRKLDQSVDIYAFGIVMWEVFTRKPPYAEFAPDFEDLPIRVVEGLRPRFPSHCPPHFRALAQACWAGDAAQRPTAAAVVTCLQSFLDSGVSISGPGAYEQSRALRSGAVPGPSRLQGC
ncbi:hypothetical protein Vretifemale_15427 [Volvox reticuliferus]|nr:hypothetical protein Vretifemale_15427 [Volvox reticuliferus]